MTNHKDVYDLQKRAVELQEKLAKTELLTNQWLNREISTEDLSILENDKLSLLPEFIKSESEEKVVNKKPTESFFTYETKYINKRSISLAVIIFGLFFATLFQEANRIGEVATIDIPDVHKITETTPEVTSSNDEVGLSTYDKNVANCSYQSNLMKYKYGISSSVRSCMMNNSSSSSSYSSNNIHNDNYSSFSSGNSYSHVGHVSNSHSYSQADSDW
jgi:hypothetical protein